jgi:hypothetical protein
MRTHRTIRSALALALAGAALAASAADARAQGRRAYSTDKEFGLGIMLGAPSGLSGKYFFAGQARMALAFGAGYYDEFYYHHGTQLHADLLFHPVVLASADAFDLPLYIGGGIRLLDHDDYIHRDRYYDDHTHLGLRVPFGLSFDFRRVPLDAFVELVPVWDFDDDHGDRDLDLTGALGVRYYF